MCNKHHTYERTFAFGKGQVPSTWLSSCQKFLDKMPKERGEFLESIKGCYACTNTKHQADKCRFKDKVNCHEATGGGTCGGHHHRLLHNCGVVYCNNAEVRDLGDTNVLFEVQEVDMPGYHTPALTLFDPCASASLITHESW